MKARFVVLLAVLALGFVGYAAAAYRNDPQPGSRRTLAIAELVQACDWMHSSTKKHGLGYSIAHVQTTHVYRALVIMGGVWPAPQPTTSSTSTSTASAAGAGSRTGPGSGSGTGPGTGVPTTTTP